MAEQTRLDGRLAPVAIRLIQDNGIPAVFYEQRKVSAYDPDLGGPRIQETPHVEMISPPQGSKEKNPSDLSILTREFYLAGSTLKFVPVVNMRVKIQELDYRIVPPIDILQSGHLIAAYKIRVTSADRQQTILA